MDRGGFRLLGRNGSGKEDAEIRTGPHARSGFLSLAGVAICVELLLVQGILTGVGMGLAFGGGILVLQSYFSARLGARSGFGLRVVGVWELAARGNDVLSDD